MSKKAIVLGCGVITLVGFIVIAAVIYFFVYATKDIEGVSVTLDCPMDIAVGQTFDLTITATNERTSGVWELSDIDISDEYLEGFTVGTIVPKPKSSMHDNIGDSQSFTFDAKIAPGESQVFVFSLRAESAGIFRGDVDFWEGVRFITNMAQTVVKEKP
jgi:hypothetical protein